VSRFGEWDRQHILDAWSPDSHVSIWMRTKSTLHYEPSVRRKIQLPRNSTQIQNWHCAREGIASQFITSMVKSGKCTGKNLQLQTSYSLKKGISKIGIKMAVLKSKRTRYAHLKH
jgi:hypothetical protein